MSTRHAASEPHGPESPSLGLGRRSRAFRGKTSAARVVGRYCIVVHASEAPMDDEWAQLLEVQLGALSDGAIRVLVATDGGAPNASQRALLTSRAAGLKMIVAVLTPSVIARAAAVAIRLFQPDIRILPRHEVEKALDHLDVLERDRPALRSALQEMRSELQGPR